jgi:hypothetical protein
MCKYLLKLEVYKAMPYKAMPKLHIVQSRFCDDCLNIEPEVIFEITNVNGEKFTTDPIIFGEELVLSDEMNHTLQDFIFRSCKMPERTLLTLCGMT